MKLSYIDEFISYLKSIKGHNPLTIKEYHYDTQGFYKFIYPRPHSDFDMEEFIADQVTSQNSNAIGKQIAHSYISYLDVVKKNSSGTRYRKISSLRAFYKYPSTVIDVCSHNPAEVIDMPKIGKSLPIYLTLDETKKLLRTILSSRQKGIYKYRDYAVVTLFLDRGMRLSELTTINRKDITDNARLGIVGKGNKERIIYLDEACMDAVNRYLTYRGRITPDNDTFFLNMRKGRISHFVTQKAIEKHLKNVGSDTNKYTAHRLRHTTATLMYRYGSGDLRALQEVLGHESVATTQIYTHVDSEEIRQTTLDNPLSHEKAD